MNVAEGQVSGTTVSDGWLRAMRMLAKRQNRDAFHLTVRFADPTEEDPNVRSAVDRMLGELGLQDVEAVANTIFPKGLADSSSDSHHLADRYRKTYPTIRKMSPKNARGTYFGRLVQRPPDDLDQLNATIHKLRQSVAVGNQRMQSTYEVDLADPDLAMSTYVAGKDLRVRYGFPCLSFLSFHLDGDSLHLFAFYRSQFMVERGYGNYLGLGRLLQYVANQVDVPAGEMLVVSGHARIDNTWGRVKAYLGRMPDPDGEQVDVDATR